MAFCGAQTTREPMSFGLRRAMPDAPLLAEDWQSRQFARIALAAASAATIILERTPTLPSTFFP
jgi:hypothetical protein